MQDGIRKVQRPEYIAAQFLFTDDFDMVLYRDETMAGIVYMLHPEVRTGI